MADSRFFKVAGPFNLEQLAEISGSNIGGAYNTKILYSDILPLSLATVTDVSFIDNQRYLNEFENSNAGVILVSPNNVDRAPTEAALLILDDPYLGYAKLTQAFYPKRNEGKYNKNN